MVRVPQISVPLLVAASLAVFCLVAFAQPLSPAAPVSPLPLVTQIAAGSHPGLVPAVQRRAKNKKKPLHADQLMIVDCLLPGQVRKIGRRNTFVTARRPLRTTARDCEIRGGEYASYDRANYQTALKVWMDGARKGSAEAQTIVGEIYEEGLGTEPNYELAAQWYQRAADQGNARATMNLAFLYEQGLGVTADQKRAALLYQQAFDLESGGTVELARSQPLQSSADLFLEQAAAKSAEAEIDALRRRISAPGTKAGERPALEERLAALESEVAARDEELARKQGAAQEEARIRMVAAGREGVAVAGPDIELIEPKQVVSRGAREVVLRSRGQEKRLIVGQLRAPSGILSFMVNGEDRTGRVTAGGLFSVEVPLSGERTPVELVAVDQVGNRSAFEFAFVYGDRDAEAVRTPRLLGGTYYGLVIGSNDYQYWPRLETALGDARAVAQVLRERYGFKEVIEVYDAIRLDILSALEELSEKITPADNLLIYYAGHGFLEKGENLLEPEMYWVPVDGEQKRVANWIPTSEIARHLNRLEARGVLVVADSCFSGWLVGAAAARPDSDDLQAQAAWMESLNRKTARLVLSSGSLQPVLDEGGGEHSVFAKYFLEVLRSSEQPLSGQQLFRQVRAQVSESTRAYMERAGQPGFVQEPDFGGIRRSRHEGGEFFFRPAI